MSAFFTCSTPSGLGQLIEGVVLADRLVVFGD